MKTPPKQSRQHQQPKTAPDEVYSAKFSDFQRDLVRLNYRLNALAATSHFGQPGNAISFPKGTGRERSQEIGELYAKECQGSSDDYLKIGALEERLRFTEEILNQHKLEVASLREKLAGVQQGFRPSNNNRRSESGERIENVHQESFMNSQQLLLTACQACNVLRKQHDKQLMSMYDKLSKAHMTTEEWKRRCALLQMKLDEANSKLNKTTTSHKEQLEKVKELAVLFKDRSERLEKFNKSQNDGFRTELGLLKTQLERLEKLIYKTQIEMYNTQNIELMECVVKTLQESKLVSSSIQSLQNHLLEF